MVLEAERIASDADILSDDAVRAVLTDGLADQYAGAKVLVLIPDHTRTIPLPQLFRMLVEILADARQLDFMVALGTHPALDDESLCKLVGITKAERETRYRSIGLLNHAWDDPEALTQIGTLERDYIRHVAGEAWHPSLGGDTPIRINRLALEYDQILIIAPTFPHEVVGFSGGAKYLFPGISGPEMINVTHWLGAIITVHDIIGVKNTPVRELIHTAAGCVSTPIQVVSMVVVKGGLAGLFIGDYVSAWSAAADLSSERHIVRDDRAYKRILSYAPPMYDELWTASKAVYKTEPVVEDGGEIILYAPQLDTVSRVHGKYIYEAGYHVCDYFLKQWERFQHIPTGALAHGAHVRGTGTFENGIEHPRIQVTLATQISREDCATLGLGYMNPDDVNIDEWRNREDEGLLFVPKAGETLYRLRRT
jgi:nickel-dependent lactate racemase